MSNKAAVIPSKSARPFEIKDVSMQEPGPDEVVIRNHAVAMNPCDHYIQAFGVIVEEYPAVIGCDAAGEVTKVGSAVTRLKPGDRVAALVDTSNGLQSFDGTFQHYMKTKESITTKLPNNIGYNEASVLPLGLSTAAGGLFESKALGLPLPTTNPKPANKVVIIWGAGSSVGSCAVQLARAAGLEVAATAGAYNLDYCRDLGANFVFDYRSETIIDDIVTALKGKESAGVFDAIMAPETIIACAQIAKKLGGRQMVATILAPGMPLPENLPEGIEAPPDAGIEDEQLKKAIWDRWLPGALADGTMKCKPDPKIVGQGLESIQEAIDLMGKGVSASKLVIEL